jgi:N-acyl-D-aspartate/D-glutamate deacylase
VSTRFLALLHLGLLSGALVVAGCSGPPATGATEAVEPFDVLITGGRVVDGTGAPWYYADVGVRDGSIVAIGKLAGSQAKETIDAKGKVVAPGFIDLHTHSDLSLLRDGRGMSKVTQGVTTEVLGEGSSVAPRKLDAKDGRWDVQPDWTTLAGYFDKLEAQGISGNVVSYISVGQLRTYVMGEGAIRRPLPEEMEQMKQLLAQGMEQGAMGISDSLDAPGIYQLGPGNEISLNKASPEDLIEFAKVVARYGGMYGVHLRDQGPFVEEAVAEAARIGRESGIRVQIFHLKASGWKNWGKMGSILSAIRKARAEGIDIAAQTYPYTAASHGLKTELPRWTHEGGTDAMIKRLRDGELRPGILKETTQYMEGKYKIEATGEVGYDAAVVSDVPVTPEKYLGKTFGQIAREAGKPADASTLDLFIEQGGDVGIVMHYMAESDLRRAMTDPMVAFDSDGTAVTPDFGGNPHPRYYGTFPRILGRYVREEKLLSLEEAVRKMTSLAASRMGLLDRGVLRTGMAADIVVFDPDTIIDRATFAKSHQYSRGITEVVVNGVTVLRGGEHTGAKPGKALRGAGYKPAVVASGRAHPRHGGRQGVDGFGGGGPDALKETPLHAIQRPVDPVRGI